MFRMHRGGPARPKTAPLVEYGPFALHGKVAVITGGGRGLGAATALRFAQAGASVALLDIAPEHARTVADRAREQGGSAVALACDVTDERAVEEAFGRILGELGGLDILVNNAGRAIRGPATESTLADWNRVIDLNLTATFLCARAAARHMRAPRSNGTPRGGAIVNLASTMGLSGGLFPNASYQASKGGVVNLTRALALEWAPDEIRVNAVAPTFVKTDFTAAVFANRELADRVMANTPLERLPEPEDVAAAIQYLASPAAHCITGIVLPVDSGFLAR